MNRAPHQREDRFLTYIALTLLAILILGFAWMSFTAEAPSDETTTNFEPHQADAGVTVSTDAAAGDAGRGRSAHLLTFSSPDGPVAITATLGGPGVHPSFEASSANGIVPVPLTYEGEQTPALEAMVTSADEEWAFWNFVEPDETHELEPAGDLELTVVFEGEGVEGARVRLSRELLSFVQKSEETGPDGLARFENIPANGEYSVDIDAPGFLRATPRVTTGAQTIELRRGVMVTGRVTARSAPVADAFVVVWVRDELGLERPEDIVSTDSGGEFRAFGLPPNEARIVAYHEAFVPGASKWVQLTGRTAELDVQLTPGVAVNALVVSETGVPVSHAFVTWRHQETGESGAKVADEEGRAQFAAVPPGSVFAARLDRFLSPPQKPGPAGDRAAEVRLTLSSGTSSGAPLRLSTNGHDITDIQATVDGTPCPMVELEPLTWQVSCEGDGTLSINTSDSGFIEVDLTFGEPLEWTLPPTQPYSVEVTAPIEESRWVEVILEVLWGETWHPVNWQAFETGRARAVANLLPGAYEARVRGSSFEKKTFQWTPGEEVEVSLEPIRLVRTRVTDSRGELLTGAYMRLWKGGGPIGDLKRSAGQLPVAFRSPPTAASLLVVDPRRGEVVIPINDVGEVTALRGGVLASSLRGRPSRAELANWLGEELVEDDRGLRVDVTHTNSPASNANVPRGAWVVDAFEDATGARTLVYWTRSGYVSARL